MTTDAAPEMVEAARRRADDLGLTDVRFVVEDAACLSFEAKSFDGVLCRFGLMLVPGMESVASEVCRVLRPGGRVVFAVWASSRLNPWMTATGRAAIDLGYSEPPDHDAPGPFRLSDEVRLRAVVEAGELRVLEVEDVGVTWRAESLEAWWETTKDTSRMLTALLAQLDEAKTAVLRERAKVLLAEHVRDDGSVVVPGVARVIAATPRAA